MKKAENWLEYGKDGSSSNPERHRMELFSLVEKVVEQLATVVYGWQICDDRRL